MLGLGNGLTGGAALGWTPAELSSLLHWYRFNIGQTTGGDTGNEVTEWADQKGSNDLTASGATEASPTGTAGGVVFDSAGDIMTWDTDLALGTFSIYFRAKFDAFGSENMIEKGTSDFLKLQTSSTVRLKAANGGTEGGRHDFTLPATISADTKFNMGWERASNDNMNIYLNGVGSEVTNGDGSQAIAEVLALDRLGKPTHTSTWYEVVICNDALSSADRALLQTYLDSI